MGEVGCAFLNGPILHRVCNDRSGGTVKALAVVYRALHLHEHVLGKTLSHNGIVEYIAAENLSDCAHELTSSFFPGRSADGIKNKNRQRCHAILHDAFAVSICADYSALSLICQAPFCRLQQKIFDTAVRPYRRWLPARARFLYSASPVTSLRIFISGGRRPESAP